MLTQASWPAITAAMISLGLLGIFVYRIWKETKEQEKRDAYVDRVYRDKGVEEKFDAIRRNRSERPEDWL